MSFACASPTFGRVESKDGFVCEHWLATRDKTGRGLRREGGEISDGNRGDLPETADAGHTAVRFVYIWKNANRRQFK